MMPNLGVMSMMKTANFCVTISKSIVSIVTTNLKRKPSVRMMFKTTANTFCTTITKS